MPQRVMGNHKEHVIVKRLCWVAECLEFADFFNVHGIHYNTYYDCEYCAVDTIPMQKKASNGADAHSRYSQVTKLSFTCKFKKNSYECWMRWMLFIWMVQDINRFLMRTEQQFDK